MATQNVVTPHAAADLLRQAVAQKYVENTMPSSCPPQHRCNLKSPPLFSLILHGRLRVVGKQLCCATEYICTSSAAYAQKLQRDPSSAKAAITDSEWLLENFRRSSSSSSSSSLACVGWQGLSTAESARFPSTRFSRGHLLFVYCDGCSFYDLAEMTLADWVVIQ